MMNGRGLVIRLLHHSVAAAPDWQNPVGKPILDHQSIHRKPPIHQAFINTEKS